MSPNYTIRLAARNHLRAIPHIEQAAAAMFSDADLPAELRFLVTDGATLLEAQAEKRLWAALHNNQKVVGFALACVVDGHGHLDEMDVHPDHGRRGIGGRLLEAVIDWARAGGFPGVTLITFRHLPWNAPFYERRGFVQIDGEQASGSLRELIRDEADAGLEPCNRVAMLYCFGRAETA